jgi:phospholipase C
MRFNAMPVDLGRIKTIVIVMMENRSFDNLLGYLCLPPNNWKNVEGLATTQQWLDKVASIHEGTKYRPFLLTDPYDLIDADPPHERDPIAIQMGEPVNGIFPMNGFVTNYAIAKGAKPLTATSQPPVMGYFGADQAPVTDFFAQNFAICDHWFSALPAGTQPNRLVAMSGFSKIDVNQQPLPDQELVYDWLTRNGIRWRVYHQGVPFFALMPRWIPDIVREEHFRPFAQLFNDVQNEPPGELPQVIFIEPTYTDAPHIGPSSDDHAPSAIKGGQAFLLEAYLSMTRLPDLWSGTVIIVTYDEHGGFFDHVPPPAIRTDPPAGAHYQRGFETLGVRVPAFVISPFVKPKTVFNGRLDHTSILKFIGQKFGAHERYSDLVDQRDVGSVSDVLNDLDSHRPAPAVPSLVPYLQKEPPPAGFLPGVAPVTPNERAFQDALDTIRAHPEKLAGKFDDLLTKFPPGA